MSANWDRARTVADAVLYEGYLLYPYRASSRKNQTAGNSAFWALPARLTRASARKTVSRRSSWSTARKASRWSCASCSCSTVPPSAKPSAGATSRSMN